MNEEERKILSIRFVVVSLIFLALAGIEGILMRFRIMNTLLEFFDEKHFYSMMTAHPFIGVYGWAYMTVMGAFYFLIPYILKKDIYSRKAAYLSFWLMLIGLIVVWGTTFLTHYAPLYTLYWPIPVAYEIIGWDPYSILSFGLGVVLILGGVLIFFGNMFATIFLPMRQMDGGTTSSWYVLKELLVTAFNLDKIRAKISNVPQYTSKAFNYPVFVVAVFRGCVDTTLNAFVIGGVGVLLVVFALGNLFPYLSIPYNVVDPLIYKNVFWWGLDLIADGNVLIFTAGTWYLLVPLILNRTLYGENIVRTVILADLVVSLFVWNHHMLADTPQPLFLQLQGQIFTWGELVTMGLTMFAVLATLWFARPVKYSMPLKFILTSIIGYAVGGLAGIIQANYASNRFFHNTQWVIGIHGHIQLLVGLSSTLFAAIYALFPLLTGKSLNERLGNIHLILWTVGGLVMGLSMGLAGTQGMLRRTLYPMGLGVFETYMTVAVLGALMMALAFTVFLINILRTVKLTDLLKIIF
ncbi:MAG: cbb3-type cytochrome c oxidase subunit I [Aigarchaeota archaeon]|nr:cbb3-type cytochrome c oxidase subunit I [Aigarchaeota archaeon]MCX8192639.1 cbb3-type cytochrome c oxidase subunit I [Nitrososphaeria archaeon]MDW7985599.1 cbb3-type cytochrome c oxidase subunit I [Nitrososphaerota archaeon]